MNEIRIIFSPQTADPRYVADVAAAAMAAQWSVAQAVWGAQIQVLRAVLRAQFTFMDSVSQAATRTR
jgi:hypothetical protein